MFDIYDHLFATTKQVITKRGMEKLMSENAVEILFQRTATVVKVETERNEIRDDKYKVTGYKITRTVTVTVPYGTESYHHRELLFEHPTLEPGQQVRIVITSEPALTEADIAPSKVTEIA